MFHSRAILPSTKEIAWPGSRGCAHSICFFLEETGLIFQTNNSTSHYFTCELDKVAYQIDVYSNEFLSETVY